MSRWRRLKRRLQRRLQRRLLSMGRGRALGVLMGSWGVPRGVLWRSLGGLGGPWGVVGVSWTLPGGSLGIPLTRGWVNPGPPRVGPARSQKSPKQLFLLYEMDFECQGGVRGSVGGSVRGSVGCSREALGGLWGSSWGLGGSLGGPLGGPWGSLGGPWGPLGFCWAVLEASGGVPGRSLGGVRGG